MQDSTKTINGSKYIKMCYDKNDYDNGDDECYDLLSQVSDTNHIINEQHVF